MMCFKFSHYRDLMVFEGKIALRDQQIELLTDKLKDKESKISALVAENNELINRMMEMEQYIRSGGPMSNQSAMPTQARDWKHVAEATEARAMLRQL